jgi:predicted nucleotidyltransferase
MSTKSENVRPVTLDEVMAREIVRRILTVAQPDRIIVFGSGATDEMTKDSDIDLLVLEPEAEDPREEIHRIRTALNGLGFPFDVVVMSTRRFEETKRVIGGIAYPAHKYGAVIYEAA